MRSIRVLLVPVMAGTLLVPGLAGQKAPHGGGSGPRQAAPRQAVPPRPAQTNGQIARGQSRAPTGEEILGTLSRMSTEQRERALSDLPQAKRDQIEERIRNFQKLTPAQQSRQLEQVKKLNSLSPDRQNDIRRSMQDRSELPDDRKKAVNQELRRITAMPDEDRKRYMKSGEFRGRFSSAEQKMIRNLSEVLPSQD
jgi:Protein of unknown function (DUF3106)